MIIYGVAILMPLLLRIPFQDINTNNRKRLRYCTACAVFLILFMGLRSKYLGGTDTFFYCADFDRALSAMSWELFYRIGAEEIGYQFFVWILAHIFDHSQYLILLTAAFFAISILYLAYKYSYDITLSVILYMSIALMVFHWQGMRQSIAMCICIFAFEMAMKRKLIPFILLILLAASFHRTAIVFAIVYFLIPIKYTKQKLLLIIGTSMLVIFASERIVSIANNLFSMNFNRVYNAVADSGGYIVLFIHIFIIIVTLVWNPEKYENHECTHLFYVALIGIVCYIMRYFGAREAERISFYFMFAEIILLPNSIAYMKRRDAHLVRFATYSGAILFFLYKMNADIFCPYQLWIR